MRELRRMKLRRWRRNWRSRRKVFGAPERPRLIVYRSDRHIYCQIIDDTRGQTLVAASTLSEEIRNEVRQLSWNRKGAEKVGALIAQRALQRGITKVCFDRNGYKFHGRVKALAESARKAGLQF